MYSGNVYVCGFWLNSKRVAAAFAHRASMSYCRRIKKICRCCLVESWILNGWCLQVGVVPTQEALQRSRDADLDLVRDFPVLGDISCSWFNHVMWRKFRITIEGQSQRSLKSNNRCYDLGEHKRMELFTTVVLSGPFLVLILSVSIGGYGTKE